MTSIKSLAAAGALLAVCGAAFAQAPQLRLERTAGTPGTDVSVVVTGIVNNGTVNPIVSATVDLAYDSTKLTYKSNSLGTDWSISGSSTATAGKAKFVLTNLGDPGQAATGPIMTVVFTLNAAVAKLDAASLTLASTSAIGDPNRDYPNPPPQAKPVLNGKISELRGNAKGAPSVGLIGAGLIKVIAAPIDNKLRIVKATDLSDQGAAGGVDLTQPASGRPLFGKLGATDVVVVGTVGTNAKLAVVDATTGALTAGATGPGLVSVAGATKVGTPVVAPDGTAVFAIADLSGSTSQLVRVGAAGTQTSTSLAGVGVGAPAMITILSGATPVAHSLVVGTSSNVYTVNVDPLTGAFTPKSSSPAACSSSPVVGSGGIGTISVGTTDVTFLSVNLATGALSAASPTATGAGPVSDGFPVGSTIVYGGGAGKLITVTPGTANGTSISAPAAPAVAPQAGLTGNLLQPLVINGVTFAIDVAGNAKSSVMANSINLGGNAVQALSATGQTPGTDSLIGLTSDGGLIQMPF